MQRGKARFPLSRLGDSRKERTTLKTLLCQLQASPIAKDTIRSRPDCACSPLTAHSCVAFSGTLPVPGDATTHCFSQTVTLWTFSPLAFTPLTTTFMILPF